MAAAKKTAPAKGGKPGNGGKKKKGGMIMPMLVVMIFLVVIWPTAVLLIPGMIPALVALVTDRDKEKALALTVGATNFAGCLPFVLQLWSMGHNVDNAMKLLRDPNSWFIMFSAAGIGYAIYAVVPSAVASIMAGNAGGRITRLRANLEELKRVWGPDVATDRKFDSFGNAED